MRTPRHAPLVAVALLLAACGSPPDAAPRGPAAADSVVTEVATSTPRLAAAVVTAAPDPAPALTVGDTLRIANALVAPPAGQLQALKSAGTGKYAAYRAGVASYIRREYRNGALLRADTLRYAVGATAPPPVVTPPAVSVSVTTECPSAACPAFRVPTTQAASAVVTRGGVRDSTARLAWTIGPAPVCAAQDAAALPGRFRAIAAGSCTIIARDSASGATGARTIVVSAAAAPDTTPSQPPPPPTDTQPTPAPPPPTSARFDGAAELPRATFAPRRSETPASRVVPVPAGGDLGAALASCTAGTELRLAAGATYTGNFETRAAGRGSSGWCVVRTAAELTPEGTRVDTATARRLGFPRIVTPNAAAALSLLQGAGGLRLINVAVAPAGAQFLYYVSAFGSHEWTDPAAYPDRVVLDAVVVDGGDADLSRCVALNGTNMAVVDSWLGRCHGRGRDSQALSCAGGAGPYTVLNNVLEGAGENFMCGGADARAPSLVPADITFVGNHVSKPDAWRTSGGWSIKNLFELKAGRRVRVEGNVFEGNWTQSQSGTAILLKSTNQECTATYTQTADVVFRLNVVKRTEHGINVAENPEAYRGASCAATPMARVTIRDNLVQAPGKWLTVEGTRDLTVAHNTGRGGPLLQINGGVAPGFAFEANDGAADGDGRAVYSADGHGEGAAALDYHYPGARFARNRAANVANGAAWPAARNGPAAADAGADSAAVAAATAPALAGVRSLP